ncbi:MAG: hypothetical protein AB1767_10130 [Bacillota bacterium]
MRNSNLAVAGPEGDFYTAITDRLTGLRTGEIAEIKKKLYDMAGITEKGYYKNVSGNKLKERLEQAEAAAVKIDGLLERLAEVEFEKLEQEQAACAEELRRINAALEALEQARRREIYLKGTAALEQLRAAAEAAASLERFNAADERRWADGERDIERLSREKSELQAALQQKEEGRAALTRELLIKQSACKTIDERKKTLDEAVRPELINYEQKLQGLTRRQGAARLLAASAAVAAAALVISLLGAVLSPSPFFIVTAAASALAAGGLALSFWRLHGERSALAVSLQRMRSLLSRYSLPAGSVEEVRAALQSVTEEHAAAQEELNRLQRSEDTLAAAAAELRQKIARLAEESEQLSRAVDAVKLRSGTGALSEYAAQLKHKDELEQQADRQKTILHNLFEGEGPTGGLAHWESALQELESYKELAAAVKYSEKSAASLQEKRQTCLARIAALGEQTKQFAAALKDVEREANRILETGEDYLHCQTATDLREIGAIMRAFLREHAANRDDALQVITVFNEIEAEERDRVSALFGAASPVSGYFHEITGGLYSEVLFDRESSEIRVTRRDGARLSAGKLSGGAFDQLYLAVRLALGEKLLKGEQGFFILDDPFIKSDTARLQRQLQTLLRVAEQGWQVIYFTAKDEVPAALRTAIDGGTVNHIVLQGIFSI